MSHPRRFFVPTATLGETVTLSREESKHAIRVLRLTAGEPVAVFNEQGEAFLGAIQTADPQATTIHLQKAAPRSPATGTPKITVAAGIAKGKHFDLLVRLITELGAEELWPLLTERTVIKPSQTHGKADRWKRIALEAAKQSRRTRPLAIADPNSLQSFLNTDAHFDQKIIACLEAETVPLKQVLIDTRESTRVLALIGPEGDFTAEEVRLAQDHGCIPVALTPTVLRVETAAAFLVSAVVSAG